MTGVVVFAAMDESLARDAHLVWLKARTKPRGLGGPTYGTLYDLQKGCPQCGTGSHQVTPLYLRAADAPADGNVWQTLDGELLLASGLSWALRSATGVELRQAVSSEHDSIVLPWFQVLPLYELPPMAPATVGVYQNDQGRTAPCGKCRRDGWFTRTEYRIRYELDLTSVPDFANSYEYFGRSVLREPFSKSHFARPLIIVSSSTFDRLREAGAIGISGFPIDLIASITS